MSKDSSMMNVSYSILYIVDDVIMELQSADGLYRIYK